MAGVSGAAAAGRGVGNLHGPAAGLLRQRARRLCSLASAKAGSRRARRVTKETTTRRSIKVKPGEREGEDGFIGCCHEVSPPFRRRLENQTSC